MHVYIDESVHTGANLFDSKQPNFLSLAMASPTNFDNVFRERVAQIARAAGVAHLHANELGQDRVESIAASVLDLIEFSQVRFHFALVHKPDVAAIKFYDAVFDPGENPAAPHHTYVVRSLRLLNLLKFAAILNLRDCKLFWDAMTSVRSPEAEGAAVSAIEGVLKRVKLLPDARSRQLLRDTLSWARDNVGEFSIWTPRKQDRYGHLPNIFTFPALMTGMYEAAKIWGSPMEKIIHDQQSQFGATLRQWHSFFLGVEPERIVHFGGTPVEFPDLRDSRFETSDSRVSPGLQIVDVVLWIFSRIVSNNPVGQQSLELYERCISVENIFVMSLSWIGAEVEVTMDALMSKPMTANQLQQGRKLMDRVERLRKRRIRDASMNKAIGQQVRKGPKAEK